MRGLNFLPQRPINNHMSQLLGVANSTCGISLELSKAGSWRSKWIKNGGTSAVFISRLDSNCLDRKMFEKRDISAVYVLSNFIPLYQIYTSRGRSFLNCDFQNKYNLPRQPITTFGVSHAHRHPGTDRAPARARPRRDPQDCQQRQSSRFQRL